MNIVRIEKELAVLREGGQVVDLCQNGRPFVVFRRVPTTGPSLGLPPETDVIVPVPEGYPAAMIDLAGLPVGSPFLIRVRGGQNNQGVVTVDGRQWQLASYHPHGNGGGPPWDQNKHGFHTYYDYILSWLDCLG